MRTIILAALATAAISVTACSPSDRQDLKEGADAAGAEVKDAAQDIANDPDVKQAGAAIKNAGAEAAEAVKDTAAEAQEGLSEASQKDREEAAAEKARGE
ncbi:MAG: cell surface protein [Caulobacter sp.]|nr:cell surface protein [Caulobacter sp.]